MKIKSYYLLFILLLGLSCNTEDNHPKLLVATAANLQYVMLEVKKVFEENHTIEVEIITSSSGKLTAQILQGAPYDLFISADTTYPEQLNQNGLALSPPAIYAEGKLVAWSLLYELNQNLDFLQHPKYRKIVIANPETAPYGQAAVAALQFFNLAEPLKSKLVFGESISQTNQFISTKAAEVGITAKSVVMAPSFSNQGYWVDIPEKAYPPIKQAAVLLSNKKEAKRFYDYLFSETAKTIFKKHGYGVSH